MAAAWTKAEDRQLRELHAQGVSQGETSRRMGKDPRRVSDHSKTLGLSWDRSRTKVMTEALVADNRAKRAELEAVLLQDGLRLRAQVWEPHEYIDHGGKDFDEVRWVQPEPSPVDKLKLMQAAGIAVTGSLKIAVHDSDSSHDDAKSMLTGLAAALGLAFRAPTELEDLI